MGMFDIRIELPELGPRATARGPALACDLGALPPTLRRRHLANTRALLAQVQQIERLDDGYAMRFGTEATRLARAFIAAETRCCPFLELTLRPDAPEAGTWLRLTGPRGVHRFLEAEFHAALPDGLDWPPPPSAPH